MKRTKWMKRHLNARRRKIRRMRFRRVLNILALGTFAIADIWIPGSIHAPTVRAVGKFIAAEALRRKRKELENETN